MALAAGMFESVLGMASQTATCRSALRLVGVATLFVAVACVQVMSVEVSLDPRWMDRA